MKIKHIFLKSFASQPLIQIVWACIIVAGVFGAVHIFGHYWNLAPLDTIVNMISPVPLHDAVEDSVATSDAQPHSVQVPPSFLFITYLVGLIAFSGILIATLSNVFRTLADRFKNGDINYSLSNHVVILGYNDMIVGLIRQLRKKSPRVYIMIQSSRPIDNIRQALHTQLTKKEVRRIVFIHSNRDSEEDLKKLYIDKALEIYLLGEMNEENHDALNFNCLRKIAKICTDKHREENLDCHTLLEEQSNFVVLQRKENYKLNKDNKFVTFLPFNSCEQLARKVLVLGENCQQTKADADDKGRIVYPNLDRDGIKADTEQSVHLVIIGMTSMGIALAMEAAHVAHYPNFITKKKKTRITFIDKNACKEMKCLLGRFAHLFQLSNYTYQEFFENGTRGELIASHPQQDFLDIEWEFIQSDVTNPQVQEKLKTWSLDKSTYLTVAVCLTQPTNNIAVGLYFPDTLYNPENDVSILLYQRIAGYLFEVLGSAFPNVRPFGMCDDCLSDNALLIKMAKRINYLYDYCYNSKTDYPEIVLPEGFPSDEILNELWNKLAVAKQWSNLYNTITIPSKLRSVGIDYKQSDSNRELTEEEIKMLAEVEHNRWNVEELFLNFRPVTDEEYQIIKDDIELRHGAGNKKGNYKNEQYAHYDIRPYDKLENDVVEDNNKIKYIILPICRYDLFLSKGLYLIIKEMHKWKGMSGDDVQ